MLHRGRVQISRIFLCGLISLFLIIALPIQAQEVTESASPPAETTIAPAETLATETPSTEVPVAAEIPSETPTDEPAVVTTEAPVESTVEATVEVTPSETPSETATEAATETPSETPGTLPTEEASAPLPLAFSANFDAGFPAELGAGTGWLSVTVNDGLAVQNDGAGIALYNAATFTDVEIEAKILLNSGDVTWYASKSAADEYTAVLSADGTLKLFKNGEHVNTGTALLTPGIWVTLKFSAVGGALAVSVDDAPIVTATDFAPLPSGQAGFSAAAGTLVRVDDVAIYGVPDGVPEVSLPPLESMSAEEEPTLPPIESMVFDAPSGLAQTGSTQTSITITWSDNSTEETNYRVERSFTGGANWLEITVPANSTTYTDTTITCGLTAQYRVRAYRSSDNSYTVYSNVLDGSTQACTPQPCQPNDAIIRASTGSNGVPQNTTGVPISQISGNGQYVMFMTESNNLVPGDTNNQFDLFRYNRLNCQVEAIALGNFTPAQGYVSGYISADGNLVVFNTQAALVPEDTNGLADIYVKNMTAGTFQRVSVNGAAQGNADADDFGISLDGRYVAFTSAATSLLPEDTTATEDIYLYDRQTGSLTLISLAPDGITNGNGNSYVPSVLVAGGKPFVVFHSAATNLLAGDTNGDVDMFVRDVDAGTTYLVTKTSGGGFIDTGGGSAGSNVATDGTNLYIPFTSGSTQIVPGDLNGETDMFLHTMPVSNLPGGTVQAVSLADGSTTPTGNDGSQPAFVTENGRYVIFHSFASNLVAGDTPGMDTFLRDLQTNTTTRILANGYSIQPSSISSNGTYLDFGSREALIPAVTNIFCVNSPLATVAKNCFDAYIMTTGIPLPGLNPPSDLGVTDFSATSVSLSWSDNSDETNFRIERSTNGGTSWQEIATVPADTTTYQDTTAPCNQNVLYRVRAFRSSDSVFTGYSNTAAQVTANCSCNPAAVVQMASVNSNGQQGTTPDPIIDAVISGNGRYALVWTNRDFPNHITAASVFRYDRQTCTLIMIDGTGSVVGTSPSLSADGNRVVFAGDVAPAKIYMRDIATGTTPVVSLNTAGEEANDAAFSPDISADGQKIVFGSKATNLVAGDTNGEEDVFLRDLQTGITTRVSVSTGGAEDPNTGVSINSAGTIAISANGRYVAFITSATFGHVNDTNSSLDVYVRDTQTNTTKLASLTSAGDAAGISEHKISVSNNGRVVFTTQAQVLPADTDSADDVYTFDFADESLRLASLHNDGSQTVSRSYAHRKAISDDGRYVAFTMQDGSFYTTGAVPGNQVWVRDLNLSRTAPLSRNSSGQYANQASQHITIAGNASRVAFLSEANNLVTVDTNNDDDAFIASLPEFVPYDPPSNLEFVSSTANSVTIRWTDNTAYETNFRVERQLDDGTWAQVAIVPGANGTGTTVSASSTGLICGNGFTYRVRAFHSSLNLGFTSYSSTLDVQTQPCTGLPPCPALSALTPVARLSGGVGTIPPGNANVINLGSSLMTNDGHYAVFSSAATDLVNNSPNTHEPVVYRYDIHTCVIVPVAVDGGGMAVASDNPAISDDGNFIAFDTEAALVAGDTNNQRDVYLRDMTTGTYTRISLAQDGVTESNGSSVAETISSDGRFVIFNSLADNLLPGLTNPAVCYDAETENTAFPCADMFLYDTQTDTLTPLSLNPAEDSFGDGHSYVAAMFTHNDSPYVVFTSEASNLTGDDTILCEVDFANAPLFDFDESCPDVFLRDVNGGTTYLLSRSNAGNVPGNSYSWFPDVGFDGTNIYVSFLSLASNLVTVSSGGQFQTFLRVVPLANPNTGTTELISRASGVSGAVANSGGGYSSVSSSGRFVAFETQAGNLVIGDTNGKIDVFVRDRQTNTTTRVSMSGAVQGNGDSGLASMNNSGLHILFYSDASNLAAGDTNAVCEVDGLDADETLGGVQADGNENCFDLFVSAVPGTQPGGPGFLNATTYLATQINLTWAAIANIDEYRVERSFDSGANWMEIAVVLPPTTTYPNIGFFCGMSNIKYRVRGYRAADAYFTAYTNIATGATPACAAPVQTTPLNGFQTQGNVALNWNPVANSGNNYRVYVATDAGFVNQVGLPADVTTNSHFIASLADGTYYWRVQVFNTTPVTAGGLFSLTRSFIIDTQPLLALPVPMTPINNATVNTARPYFTWSAVTGAISYQLEINDDPTFTDTAEYASPLPGQPGVIASTAFILPNTAAALLQGDYYWRVRAFDPAGNLSNFSALTPKLTVNLLWVPVQNMLYPLYGTAASAPVTFYWMGVTGTPATTYQVQIDPDGPAVPDFTGDVITCPAAGTTTLTYCTLSGVNALTANRYAWRVLVNGQSAAPTHPYRIFFVSPPAPAAPVLTLLHLPAVNAVFSDVSSTPRSAVDFSWAQAVGSGTPYTYTLEIDNTYSFTTQPEFSESGINALNRDNVDLSALPEGLYYWRVKAVNSLGVSGLYSVPRPFKIDVTPPTIPGLWYPPNDAVLTTARPIFYWLPATDVSLPLTYRLDISTQGGANFDSGLISSYIDLQANTTSLTLPLNLPHQGEFFWRVRAVDAGGNTGENSQIRRFTFNLSNAPAQNATVAPGNVNFYWFTVPGATGYQVQIDTDGNGDFASPVLCPAAPTLLTYCTASLTTPGAVAWRVMVNAPQPVGNAAGAYRILYVKTGFGLPAPTGVKLEGETSTAPYQTDIYINDEEKTGGINLVWTAPNTGGLTIQHYVIEYSPTPAFTTILATQQTLDGTTTQMPVPPEVMAADGTNKYARVRAVYEPGTGSSLNTPAFWFVVDTAPPAVPGIVSPMPVRDSTAVQRPTLLWSIVPGAVRYLLDVATSSDFSTDNLLTDQAVLVNSYMFPAPLALKKHYWRVRAVDVAGNRSAENPNGNGADFLVFAGTIPANSAVNQAVRPYFAWQAVPGALTYTLEVDRDGNADFAGNVYSFITPNAATLAHYYPAAQPALTGVVYWRVYPTGTTPPADYFASFSVLNALAAPVLNPADTMINAAEYPAAQLSWNAPAGVPPTQYVLQVANNVYFSGAVTVTTGATSVNLSPLMDGQADGLKYWRVQAEYLPGFVKGPVSVIGSFTLDRIAPNKPVGLNVSFGVSPSRPLLYWTAVPGVAPANGYEIDVTVGGVSLPGGGFPKPATYASFAFASTSLILDQAPYEFRVKAVDAAGNISPESDPFTFVVNLSNAPANNGIVYAPAATTNSYFYWFAMPGVNTYQVQVDADGDFSSGAFVCPATPANVTACVLTGLPRGTYVWRVLVNGAAVPPEIKRSLFVIGTTMLTAPGVPAIAEVGAAAPYLGDSLISAAEKAGVVNVTWSAPGVMGATVASYDVEFSASPYFSPLLASVNGVAGLAAQIPPEVLAADGIKYVRVRANYSVPGSSVAGAFSTLKMFTVDTTPPLPPVLTSPKGGLMVVTRTPGLSFAAAAGAVRYRLELATSDTFAGPLITTTINTTYFVVPNAQALANGVYFWRAMAIDAAGNESGLSAVAQFVVNAP